MYDPLRMLRQTWNQSRHVREQSGVPVHRQLAEVLALRPATGLSRAEYYLYRLWRRERSLAERLQYLSLRERRLSEFRRNPEAIRGRHRIGGKSAGSQRIAATGARVPEHLAEIVLDPDGTTFDVPVLTTCEAFRDFLADAPADGLVIKPERGYGGHGIRIVVAVSRSEVVMASGEHVTVGDLWHSLSTDRTPWRLERRVLAHPVVAGWRPGATPTVRLTTAVVDGAVHVHCAMAKVNRNPNGVDNFQAGNLAGAVDLASGAIGPAVDYHGAQWYDRHPESGTAIAGVMIPDWPRFLDVVRGAAPAFLPLKSLGWDVAISPDGPVVLEVNPAWSEIVQLPLDHGIVRGAFVGLLREVGAGWLLDRRERACPGWIDYATALE